MYDFEFESYMNLNLKYLNIVVLCIFQIVSASPSLVSAGLS
jgi:hypothetical protein